MSIEVGAVYRTSIEVTNSLGALADSITQVLTVTLPDQTTATPSITHDSDGKYHADVTLTQEGLYKFLWTTTGPLTSKADYVNASVFRSIVGIDEVREFINDYGETRDGTLRLIMAAATQSVEDVVGTCVIKTITDERITGYTRAVIRLPSGPLPDDTSITSITSVWPNGPVWLTKDLIVYPESGTCEPINMMQFWYGPWKATYVAGRYVISPSIQLATKEIIFDLWSIHRNFGADALEPGPEETARFETLMSTYTIPPHAAQLLSSDESPGFA